MRYAKLPNRKPRIGREPWTLGLGRYRSLESGQQRLELGARCAGESLRREVRKCRRPERFGKRAARYRYWREVHSTGLKPAEELMRQR